MLTPRQETERKAQSMANGLGITVWITEDGRIVQSNAGRGATEFRPAPGSTPTPHGSPTKYEESSAND
jgi:hypothetical protein